MHLICTASLCSIDLDKIFDAKSYRDFEDAHTYIGDTTYLEHRLQRRTRLEMPFARVIDRLDDAITPYFLRLDHTKDTYEIAFVNEREGCAMLLAGTFDFQTDTFEQSKDTCLVEDYCAEDRKITQCDLSIIKTVVFHVD